MGYSCFRSADWVAYSTATASAIRTKGRAAVFTSHSLKSNLDPTTFDYRESRDSDINPQSTAVILGIDETGSMGNLAEQLVKRDLGVLAQNLYDKKPITDPHIMCVGIGDAEAGDAAPCQMTQFEAGYPDLTPQIEDIFLEGAGGGNDGESYTLLWLAAAMKTRIDCFEKRGRRGYLFTVGDEPPLSHISRASAKRVLGVDLQADMTSEAALILVSRQYEVFHLIVAEGSDARRRPAYVRGKWNNLLGQRALWLADHTKMGEVIVSTIQLNEGADRDRVLEDWDGSTSLVVAEATKDLVARPGGGSGGLVAF